MQPDIFDQLVIRWCSENGWEKPTKVNEEWWAIAPGQFVPQPIPADQQLNLMTESIARSLGVAYEHIAQHLMDLIEVLKTNPPNFSLGVERTFQPRSGFSVDIAPKLEPLPLKELKKRNKKKMRDFLKSRYE